MMELVFIACLAGSNPTCQENSLLYVDMPLLACLRQAPFALAEWAGTHPAWRVRRWSCRRAGEESRA
jgi:hypothetical protein